MPPTPPPHTHHTHTTHTQRNTTTHSDHAPHHTARDRSRSQAAASTRHPSANCRRYLFAPSRLFIVARVRVRRLCPPAAPLRRPCVPGPGLLKLVCQPWGKVGMVCMDIQARHGRADITTPWAGTLVHPRKHNTNFMTSTCTSTGRRQKKRQNTTGRQSAASQLQRGREQRNGQTFDDREDTPALAAASGIAPVGESKRAPLPQGVCPRRHHLCTE